MSKKIIYVAFWNNELDELINFLKLHKYNEGEIDRLEYLLKEVQHGTEELV
jgi:hypothetical protein